ncbi:MAG: right-handed parallel beta-helix repeat-containing protein [Bacteroidota bacterium]
MKKLKTTMLFVMLLMAINSSFAQTLLLSEPDQTDLQDLLITNPTLVSEPIGTTISNAINIAVPILITATTPEIACHPVDDIFNLQCPRYQLEVTGNDYTAAIQKAINDAVANNGGVILFPGNTVIEIDNRFLVPSNITLRASHSTATIRCSDNFDSTHSQMFYFQNAQNISFEGITFDANKKAMGIVAYSTTGNSNINITDCIFKNSGDADALKFYSGIQLENVTGLTIKDCEFKSGFYGITLTKRNTRVYIENNKFESTLDDSPIRIHGSQSANDFSSHVWVRNNEMYIGRSPSIIEILNGTLSRNAVGAVEGIGSVNGNPAMPATSTSPATPEDPNYNETYYNWRNGHQKGHYAIDITCKSTFGETSTSYHENIVVENNIALGPDYGFFDGGSADLFGLKDIVRLKCVNNVARNSGDLGFAIVNCTNAIVSGNTAERNNSSGIGIFDTRNSVISGNIFENNALRRDYIYNGTPYGGILITGGKSYNNILEGNHFFAFKPIDVSLPINEPIPPSTDDYTVRDSASDYYGIVIRPDFYDVGSGSSGINFSESPFLNKIGNNHYAGLKWGPIYNPIPSTQLSGDFSGITFPTNQDYPLGTWVRNSNMNNPALGWSVVNRVETELHSDWIGGTHIEVKDESNSIQKDDIFGVMLDDGNVHWSIIEEIIPQVDHYLVKLAISPPSDLTAAGIEDPAPSRTQTSGQGMDRIVILRWLTVTK